LLQDRQLLGSEQVGIGGVLPPVAAFIWHGINIAAFLLAAVLSGGFFLLRPCGLIPLSRLISFRTSRWAGSTSLPMPPKAKAAPIGAAPYNNYNPMNISKSMCAAACLLLYPTLLARAIFCLGSDLKKLASRPAKPAARY
jgi:hypothetical protein